MNNKAKKIHKTLWVIFLLFIILLGMIFALLYNFASMSKKSAKSVVEQELYTDAQRLAKQIYQELDIMTKMGLSFRDVMVSMPIQDQKDRLRLIGALYEHSQAYMVVWCDDKGIGYTNGGIKINVKDDNVLLDNADEPFYVYLQSESILQEEAIVSVIPIVKNNENNGYILMYYSVSHIRELFEEIISHDDTFMLFSVDDGLIATTQGLEEELPANIMLNSWLQQLDSTFKSDKVEEAILNNQGTSFHADMNEIAKYVICIPIEINDWYVTIGYENDLYEQMLADEWSTIKSLIVDLYFLIIVFLFFAIGIAAITYNVYDKNNRKLQAAADTDLLTNLYNKITTEKKIKEYINKNPGLGAVLFILDLDDFKKINDTLGHFAGDEVLKKIGDYLRNLLVAGNIVGRIGGDEFVIFIMDIKSEEERERQIEKVYLILREFANVKIRGEQVTFSIGSAFYPKDANNFEELFEAADHALYEAKKKGKNQLVQYEKK